MPWGGARLKTNVASSSFLTSLIRMYVSKKIFKYLAFLEVRILMTRSNSKRPLRKKNRPS